MAFAAQARSKRASVSLIALLVGAGAERDLPGGCAVLGDGEVFFHEQVVEELAALPGAREAELRAGVGGQGADVATVEQDLAAAAHETGDGVDERRLAGPVGSDQADELALADLEADVAQRVHAAEVDRDPVAGEHWALSRALQARRPRARQRQRGPRAFGWDDVGLAVGALVERSGDALGVLQERDDEDHAAEQEEVVAVEAEPLVERVGEERLRRDQPGEHRARDQRDAAGVGERDQAERRERVEAVGADRAGVVGVKRARDAGDEGADAEGDELDVARVDRSRGGGALVGAHGEHAQADPAAADVADHQAHEQRDDERDPAEHGARDVPVQPAESRVWAQVQPDEPQIGHGRAADPGADLRIVEVELGDRHRGGERHDHEADAAHAQCRGRRHETEHDGSSDPRERGPRERDPVIDGEPRDDEARHARETELHDRDLADEARDDDQ